MPKEVGNPFISSIDLRGETFREDQETRFVLERKVVRYYRGEPPEEPDVDNVVYIQFVETLGFNTTFINFKNGRPGQRLFILGDGNTSVANNPRIQTNTNSTKLLLAGRVYRFTAFDLNIINPDNVFLRWFEDV